MSYGMVNQATGDGYTEAATVVCPNAEMVVITVTNASVLYQLGRGWPAVSAWDQELDLIPGVHRFVGRHDAVRFRSMVPGTPARVSVRAE